MHPVMYTLAAPEGVGKFTLPEGHLFGMRVPKGGSDCSKCKFVSKNLKHCGNPYFQEWRKSLGADPSLLPLPADEYCCDVFAEAEPAEAQKQAQGRNTFYDYPENRARDGIVSFVKHVGYIKKEPDGYCVHSESNPDWNGGCYPSKEKAEERLRQVEYFKHKGASDQAVRVVLRFLDAG